MQYAIETWFERDRAYIGLYPADDAGRPDTNQDAVCEFWDSEVGDMIEMGFIEPENYLKSMIEYATTHNLIDIKQKENDND